MNDQHTKVLNTDKNGKNRLRYASSRKRARTATSDVYRSYKRRIGVTSAAAREERVHHTDVVVKSDKTDGSKHSDEATPFDEASTFANELDIALDRNASEIFSQFHREIWPLVRSLPEILHHSTSIVEILLAYALSPSSTPGERTVASLDRPTEKKIKFIPNLATTDVLHLLAVLARDLRHEIHPFLHTQIMPRLVNDLLSGPTEPNAQPMDVTLVEATFRTLAYIFRYDTNSLLNESSDGKEGCLEPMRQYYGLTLAHRRDLVRRLAAEAFSPLIRKIASDSGKKRHLKRILKAVVVAAKDSDERLKTDAVDGISRLFFETTRGSSGKMHSKGMIPVKCLVDSIADSSAAAGDSDLVFLIAARFFETLCLHLKWSNIEPVLTKVIDKCSSLAEQNGESRCNHLSRLLTIVHAISGHREGALLSQNASISQKTEKFISYMLKLDRFSTLSADSQAAMIDLFVSTWKYSAKQDDTDNVASRMTSSIRGVLTVVIAGAGSSKKRLVASLIVKSLMPYVSLETCMKTIGSAILVAVASPDVSAETVLEVVHALASMRPKATAEADGMHIDHGDGISFIDHAAGCSLTDAENESLLNKCLSAKCDLATRKGCVSMAAVGKAASFLAISGGDTMGGRRLAINYKRVSTWLLDLLKKTTDVPDMKPDIFLVRSMAIESLSLLSRASMSSLDDKGDVLHMVKKVSPLAASHLLAKPDSLLVLTSVASFVVTIQRLDMRLHENTDMVFESLIPNLKDKNHFRRLHTLQILASFPKRPFVVDHADLDLTEDLDEESRPRLLTSTETINSGLVGPCHIIDSLLSLESKEPDMKSERFLQSAISRVGVLGRTGKLPILYAEAASAYIIGALYIKFSPVWQEAVKALTSLAKGHEDCVWQALYGQITTLVNKYPYHTPGTPIAAEVEVDDNNSFYLLLSHWESSSGQDTSLFRDDIASAEEHGMVSRHHNTDEATVFELLWAVAEGAPQLIAAHSRCVVPIFLDFMHHQYYHVHAQDPSIRELDLEAHMDQKESLDPRRNDSLDGRIVHRRLQCMLKAFSAVNGPHQLFKHKLLLSIFFSLLDNQDNYTAKLAFSCVRKYKLPYLFPYSDLLVGFYEKGKLRDTMMKLSTLAESGKIVSDHRSGLVPVLSRILFGRISAHAGTKSSKDSPAARRSAVMSFLSGFCDSDEELYPFIYFMLRVYVPLNTRLKAIEVQDSGDRLDVLNQIAEISPEHCTGLPVQVHQGFLNVLEAVVSQFGHKLSRVSQFGQGQVSYLLTFVSVIVALCQTYEVRKIEAEESEEMLETSPEIEQRERSYCGGAGTGAGTVRSLCYHRLAEIFSKYSSLHDFSRPLTTLWGCLQQALNLLPVMVINSERVPSLLFFLVTLSRDENLIKLLNENATVAVLLCLADKSKPAVIDATLTFIDNLLSDESGCGRRLLRDHVILLLDQFTLRLGCVTVGGVEGGAPRSVRKYASVGSTTWRRELAILCQVSELVDDEQLASSACSTKAIESLFSLLLPFLNVQLGIPDADKLNVLTILDKIVSRISSESSTLHYTHLSALFGPIKAKAGNSSREFRQRLAVTLNKMAAASYSEAVPVTSAVMELTSTNTKRIDEMDYDTVIPVLSDLGSSTNSRWYQLCGVTPQPEVLLPAVQTCFYLVYNSDGVVSRGAFKAIKTLISIASTESSQKEKDKKEDVTLKWTKLLEGRIVYLTRTGLATRDLAARRLFILLIAEIARCNKNSESPNLYGDLNCLIRDDDPDLDFFLNITHVQIHRRARALQRLRKILSPDHSIVSGCPLTMQSLSNVLLPLATHPVYEVKLNIEETFALEGIATVGAIARHLSWSKYNSTLWTHLSQFERHPEQEKYLIGLICAVIDGFHFDIESQERTNGTAKDSFSSNSVWNALGTRIIPKAEALLLRPKDKGSKGGSIDKGTIRPVVALALLKLFKKLPSQLFESRLPRLLAVLCDALRNRESNYRDVARKALAKVVIEMDMKYLGDVVRILSTSLTEGYKLHVRTATVNTILTELSLVYKPPELRVRGIQPDFDKTVPALMQLILQDLFGVAQERRDAQGAQLRYVKEAGGFKSAHSLELIASMIQFQPVDGEEELSSTTTTSSIHSMVSPLLERIRTPGVPTKVARRVREGLSRIVAGLLRNQSLETVDVLKFVFTTLNPFVGKHEINSVMSSMEDELSSDDDEEPIKRIIVSGSKVKETEKSNASGQGEVIEWRPSILNASISAKQAQDAKKKEESSRHKVVDGASAPKMTGSSRKAVLVREGSPSVNDPGSISTAVFCLQLLNPTLKNAAYKDDVRGLLDSFIPLLTTCVCRCRDTEVRLLSIRCLGWLLKTNLPSLARCSKSLATETLDLLTSSGSNQELMQATFKMLTLLLSYDKKGRLACDKSSHPESLGSTAMKSGALPLDDEQMQVLISFLRESIVSSDQHNPAIGLVKAIMARRFISAEFYDLMETLLEQSVRSPKASLRDQSGGAFVNYLINYPLSPERIDQHLQQIVLNISYEYTEGRLSGIGLASSIADKLPVPLLEQHIQLFFLPLTLQLANDESKECREAVAKCLGKLTKRASTDVLQSLYTYTERWAKGNTTLRRMSLQLFGIFAENRADFLKSGKKTTDLFVTVEQLLQENAAEWEIVYFGLILLEKLAKAFQSRLALPDSLWKMVVKSMSNPHAWIKLSSGRLLNDHLSHLDPSHLESSAATFLVGNPGAMYEIARNLCFQLGANEDEQMEDLSTLIIKSLTWLLQAMKKYPELCFEEEDVNERDPVQWLMTRLSNIAKTKGIKRRSAIYKCFAAFSTLCGDVVYDYLDLMLEPLFRTETETQNELEIPGLIPRARPENDHVTDESQLAKDVLHLIEENCPSQEAFLQAYANVKTKSREKKDQRKLEEKTEIVTDPQSAAKRRIEKQDREKKRRKRRVEDRRFGRGGKQKRKYV